MASSSAAAGMRALAGLSLRGGADRHALSWLLSRAAALPGCDLTAAAEAAQASPTAGVSEPQPPPPAAAPAPPLPHAWPLARPRHAPRAPPLPSTTPAAPTLPTHVRGVRTMAAHATPSPSTSTSTFSAPSAASSSTTSASSTTSSSSSSSSAASSSSPGAISAAALAADLWPHPGGAAAPGGSTDALTPAATTAALDRHIVGQPAAKRAVAVALRNRWRRQRVQPAAFRDEIMPKNILMVGPTGCGKTEIARRLAKLADAPFIKVEATKYTELGYVGRDVEEIIKDLVEAALALVRSRAKERLAAHCAAHAEGVIVRALVGPHAGEDTVDTFRGLYRAGELDSHVVDIDAALLDDGSGGGGGPGGGGGGGGRLDLPGSNVILIEKLFQQPGRGGGGGPGGGGGGMGGGLGGGGAGGRPGGKRSLRVSEAREKLQEAEASKLLSSEQVTREAVRAAEQDGIVFIDEIDKIVESSSGRMVGGGVSSEGVQRDLLPILEGSVVPTKHGNVSTEHVLFICSGAFHSAKPSDMLAELQGRLPIRVELKGLTADDFYRILTEPDNNMIRQQQELMATEGVALTFTDGAIRAIATLAEQANRLLDNIGARRLHTVLERVLGDISFAAPERVAEARAAGRDRCEFVVDAALVHSKLDDLLKKQDLSRYVL